MSKKENRLTVSNPLEWNMWAIYEWQIRDLEGRLLTLIETMGLPQKQEDAIKGLVRQEIWKICEPSKWVNVDFAEKIVAFNRERLAKIEASLPGSN